MDDRDGYPRRMRAANLLDALVVAALAALAPACHCVEADPAALIAQRAPVGADACGEVGWFHDQPTDGFGARRRTDARARPPVGSPEPARACVMAALAVGRGFHVLVDAEVADGRIAVGWASDGVGFIRLDYQATYGMYPGTDSEELQWTGCASLESHGAACPTLPLDLCLGCVGPRPAR